MSITSVEHGSLTKRIKHFNRSLPLSDYLIPFVENKKEIKIVDIGSGPFPKTGQTLEGVKIEAHYCDRRDFTEFWKKEKTIPLFPIEYQDMEHLTYSDDSFDIVHCFNALDHTVDAESAVKEMIRILKPSGWIYIYCALDQLTVSGKGHYWDAKEDGTFVNEKSKFNLKDYGFKIEYTDNHGERRYNNIVATFKKDI